MTKTPAEILHYLITHAEYEAPISLTPLRLESPEPLTPEDVTEIHRLVRYVPALLVDVTGLDWYTEEKYSFYKHILPLIDLHWISCAGYDHLSLTKRRENDSCIGLVVHQKVVDGCCKTRRFLRFWIGPDPNEARQHERETAMRQDSMSEKLPEIYTVEGLKVYSAYIDIYHGEIEEYQGKPCIFGRINPNKSIYVEYAWNMQGRNIRPGDEGPRNRHNLVGNEQLFREAFPSEID